MVYHPLRQSLAFCLIVTVMLSLVGCKPGKRPGAIASPGTPGTPAMDPEMMTAIPDLGQAGPGVSYIGPGQQITAIPGVVNAPRARELSAQAREKIKAGDLDTALVLFEQAIQENPQLLEAYLGVGEIHQSRVDYEAAAEAYQRAAQIAPTSFDAHYNLGLMRQHLKQYDAAVQAYLYALAIDPNSFDANHHLASCYLQMGRPAEAVPYARKATDRNRRSQAAWANLGAAYSLMNLYDRAVRAYREANELGDFAPPILTGLAEAHIRLGNNDRAIAVLDVLIKREPSALAYERKGYALFRQRKYDHALAAFRGALMFDPNDSSALNGMGVTLMTKYIQAERKVPFQKEEAIRAWERSMELRPNQPRIASLIRQFGTL